MAIVAPRVMSAKTTWPTADPPGFVELGDEPGGGRAGAHDADGLGGEAYFGLSTVFDTAVPTAAPAAAPTGPPTTAPVTAPVAARCSVLWPQAARVRAAAARVRKPRVLRMGMSPKRGSFTCPNGPWRRGFPARRPD